MSTTTVASDVLIQHVLAYLHHDDLGALMQVHSTYKDPCARVLFNVREQCGFTIREQEEEERHEAACVEDAVTMFYKACGDEQRSLKDVKDMFERLTKMDRTPYFAPTSVLHALRETFCRKSDDVAHWLYQTFNISHLGSHNLFGSAFTEACLSGHLSLAMMLRRDSRKRLDYMIAFYNACLYGELHVIKWLHGIMYSDDDPMPVYEVCVSLYNSCQYGHLHVLHWLMATYGSVLTSEGVSQEERDRWFIKASSGGYVAILSWLYKKFTYPPDTLYTAFESACIYGRIVVVNWLLSVTSLDNVRPRDEHTFINACYTNNLRMAMWLKDTFGLPEQLGQEGSTYEEVFVKICGNGQLRVAKWLDTTTKIRLEQPKRLEALYEACSNGQKHVVLWLLERGGIYGSVIAEYQNNAIFHIACEYGHLDIAKLLTFKFFQVSTKARDNGCDTFHSACKNGHLDVAKWVYKAFIACRRVIFDRSSLHMTFNAVCRKGHLPVLQWLYKTFGLPRDFSMCSIVENTGTDILRWWVNTFGRLTLDIVNKLFIAACKKGNLSAAMWLHRTHGIQNKQHANHAFRVACYNRCPATAEWLAHKFKLTRVDILMFPRKYGSNLWILNWLADTFEVDISQLFP